jgi:hypothetical protein
MTYLGRTGYLATVTNQDEDQFLYELSGGATGWLGGTTLTPGAQDGIYYDYGGFNPLSNVDHWYWACGPEIGQPFYAAQVKSDDAEEESEDYYFNWGDVEPNSLNDEQCLTTLVVAEPVYDHTERGYQDTVYSWNNLAYNSSYSPDGCYYPKGYFVEYGDQGVDEGWGDSGGGSAAFATAGGALSDPTISSSPPLPAQACPPIPANLICPYRREW